MEVRGATPAPLPPLVITAETSTQQALLGGAKAVVLAIRMVKEALILVKAPVVAVVVATLVAVAVALPQRNPVKAVAAAVVAHTTTPLTFP
jgi:hypothetical protein